MGLICRRLLSRGKRQNPPSALSSLAPKNGRCGCPEGAAEPAPCPQGTPGSLQRDSVSSELGGALGSPVQGGIGWKGIATPPARAHGAPPSPPRLSPPDTEARLRAKDGDAEMSRTRPPQGSRLGGDGR